MDSVSQILLENAAIVREVVRGKRGDDGTSCFGQHRGRLGHGRSGGGLAGPPSLARESIDSGLALAALSGLVSWGGSPGPQPAPRPALS